MSHTKPRWVCIEANTLDGAPIASIDDLDVCIVGFQSQVPDTALGQGDLLDGSVHLLHEIAPGISGTRVIPHRFGPRGWSPCNDMLTVEEAQALVARQRYLDVMGDGRQICGHLLAIRVAAGAMHVAIFDADEIDALVAWSQADPAVAA